MAGRDLFYIFAGMNRRRFCKIGALAMGALGVGVGSAHSAVVTSGVRPVPMRAFRLTVIRRECYEDIQSLYLDDPEAGPCEVFSPGEVWTYEYGCVCPDGFCPRAWEVIVDCVNGRCVCATGRDDIMVVACPDGARPVIFKVELL